jgi:hypothetical protein
MHIPFPACFVGQRHIRSNQVRLGRAPCKSSSPRTTKLQQAHSTYQGKHTQTIYRNNERTRATDTRRSPSINQTIGCSNCQTMIPHPLGSLPRFGNVRGHHDCLCGPTSHSAQHTKGLGFILGYIFSPKPAARYVSWPRTQDERRRHKLHVLLIFPRMCSDSNSSIMCMCTINTTSTSRGCLIMEISLGHGAIPTYSNIISSAHSYVSTCLVYRGRKSEMQQGAHSCPQAAVVQPVITCRAGMTTNMHAEEQGFSRYLGPFACRSKGTCYC